MPLHTPRDLRIWVLTKTLDWPGRRVAAEVGTSQPTVARTLARLETDPPTNEELSELMTHGSATPPHGTPVTTPPPHREPPHVLIAAVAVAVVLVALGVAAVLAALTVAILHAPS